MRAYGSGIGDFFQSVKNRASGLKGPLRYFAKQALTSLIDNGSKKLGEVAFNYAVKRLTAPSVGEGIVVDSIDAIHQRAVPVAKHVDDGLDTVRRTMGKLPKKVKQQLDKNGRRLLKNMISRNGLKHL
jgi:hypothetical protein